MRRMMLFAGVTALAAAVPALAGDPDRRGGPGHSGHAAQKGGGQAQAERGRGGGEARADRGRGQPARAKARRGAEGRMDRQERRVEKAIGQERREIERAREARQSGVGPGRELRPAREARRDGRDWRAWSERRLVDRGRGGLVPYRPLFDRRAAADSRFCPPGLARQNSLCLPPGQLRQLIGRRLPIAARPYNVPARYRYRFADGDRYFYRYDQGAVFGFDRTTGLVASVVPLVATGLFPGEPLPIGYDVYNVPFAYRQAYPDSGDYRYRYDGDAIYRVDPDSGLVDGIVALLTGAGGLGGLGVGDLLPSGYDVYNVPIDYRDTYYDRGDAMYRYADGAIYQVDPQTRIIESVISMLV